MKKIISLLLVIFALLSLCSCGKDDEENVAVFADYYNKADSFESLVHQYGTEQSRVMFGENLVVTVFYPETEIESLDNAIREWVNSVINEYQIDASDKDFEGPAELTVVYNSYKNKNGTVSIEFTGIFSASYLAHPTDIVASFTVNESEGKILTLDDLLAEGKRNEIEEKLIRDFDIDREFYEGDLLGHWVIADNELKIILPRGEFLPMSDGTKSVVFTEKETKKLFGDGKDISETEPQTEVEATDNETVIITESEKPDINKPMVALTFDDGPSAHTQRLLEIFKKHSGKGTFFVVGNTLDNRRETLKKIASDGHEIGNHSWSHRQFTNISADEVKDQIMMTRVKIYEITGLDCTLVRPPYGACSDEVREVGKELGVSFVNWSVDTLDWKTRNADAVYKEIMKDVADGHIILCHDLHKSTVDAMERVIPELIKRGYQLVTVSELLTCKGGKLESGKMYYKQ